MEQHFTIREAAECVGKSESTLKRLVNALKDDADSPDRIQLLPTPEQWREYTKSGQPFQWKISETLLRQRFPDAFEKASGEQGNAVAIESTERPQADRIIDVLQRSISKLEEQLDRKDEQLSRKDEQLKTLTDRMYESNVLIRDLHQQLALAAPKSAATDAAVESEPVTAAAATKTKEEGSAAPASAGKTNKQKPTTATAKPGWFSFLRF